MKEISRIKIVNKYPKPYHESSARKAFWRPLFEYEEKLEGDASLTKGDPFEMEGRIRREFGKKLQAHLLEEARNEIREIDRAIFGDENYTEIIFGEFWHFYGGKEGPYPLKTDNLSRFFEIRQDLLNEEFFKKSVEKCRRAAATKFSTRIVGYSSLELSLLGSIKELMEIFENNFETMQVFLDVFIPTVFGELTATRFAYEMDYEINISNQMKDEFSKLNPKEKNETESSGQLSSPPEVRDSKFSQQPTKGSNLESQMKKAEKIWKLANGSLLFPVLLALIVCYFGIKELASLKNSFSSVIEYQQEILKEDQERIKDLHITIKNLIEENKGTNENPSSSKSNNGN